MKATMKELHVRFLKVGEKTVGVEFRPKNPKATMELTYNKFDGPGRYTQRTFQVFDSWDNLTAYARQAEDRGIHFNFSGNTIENCEIQ